MNTTSFWRFARTLKSLFLGSLLLISSWVLSQDIRVERWIETEVGYRFHLTVDQSQVGTVNTEEFIREYFRLRPEHSFPEKNHISDSRGDLHIHLGHEFKGNRILGSEIIAHYRNNTLYALNGILITPKESTPLVSIERARSNALDFSGAKSFKWEFPEEEAMLKLWKGDSSATYFPSGELVHTPKNLDFSLTPQLCYRFEINSEEPLMRKNLFIHAETGELWAEEDLIHVTDVQGSTNTKYRGVKPITTDSLAPGSYRLREAGRGSGIETYNMKTGTNYGAAVDFTDTDNYWNNYNAQFDEVAGDAHFGAEMTYDFYQSLFNRSSFDNNGTKIRSYVHYRSNYSNAFWNGSVMTYGDGNGSSVTPLTSLDICGHEITHAVTTNSAGLIYRNESGALNESFSDIFGNAIEYFADTSIFSWRMGEDIMSSGNGIRNMANPKTHGDPSTYKGQYWHTSTSDNGGVHTNSGVQNFWFYLLSTGKSGTNDNGDDYVVDSLGISKAQEIAYRNLTVYLTASSDYDEARYYAIQSAADLFGDCTKEVEATTNAWHAVGVGDVYDSSFVVADFEADTSYCQSAELVQFVNVSKNAKRFWWDFGDGTTSTQRNPSHAFPGQGNYTIKLVSEGCYNGVLDSIERASYIHIDSTQDICSGYLLPKDGWHQVHACHGFIYDHNGENDYDGLSRDTLTIDFATSDSAQISFLELDYEDGYDSMYVYDGNSTKGKLIGGFTGSKLPFGGKPVTIYSGAITVTHFSDPYVVGTGFKIRFDAFRPAISLTRTPDTTLCYNQTITLSAFGKGGAGNDHVYFWNGKRGNRFKTLTAKNDTTIYLIFGDACMDEYIYDTIRIKVRQPISFSQSSDTTICQGTEAQIELQPAGGLGTYTYSTSKGTISGPAKDYRFSTGLLQPGTYNYWIAFTDGCTVSEDTAFYKITVRDSLGLSVSPDTTLCYGTLATLRSSATGGNGQYLYNWGLGNSSNPQLKIAPLKNKTYTIRLSDGCSTYEPELSIEVTVLDSIHVEIITQDTACFGEEVTLKAATTGGKATQYEYSWSPTGAFTDQISITARADTTFQLRVSDGCTPFDGIASAHIAVRDPLALSLPNDTSICFGEAVTISVLTSGGIDATRELTWSHGLGVGKTKTLSPNSTTKYHLTLWDQCSDSVSDDYMLTINPLPIVDFEVPNNINCTGIELALNELSDAKTPSSFKWDLGDGNMSTDRNVEHTYDKPGSYDVSLWVKNEYGCVDSISRTGAIRIYEHPVAAFAFAPEKPSFLNKKVQFINQSEHHTQSFWTFGDGGASDQPSTFYTYNDSGNYEVTLRVENAIGCWDDTTQSLRVEDDFVLYIPTAFSPNLDFIDDKYGIYIRGVLEFEFMVFSQNGLVLWEYSPSNPRWDGTYKGKDVSVDHYFYRVRGTDINGQAFEKEGPFYLIR